MTRGTGSRIARTLMTRLGLAGIVVALLLAGIESIVGYHRDVAAISDQLAQIGESHLGSVVETAWLEDSERLDLLVQGIRRLPAIERVEVQDPNGLVLAAAGRQPQGRTLARHFALSREYHGRMLEIGRLSVVAALDPVRHAAYRHAWSLLAANLALILALSSLLYLMVHQVVTGRLSVMADYARRLGRDGPAVMPPLDMERARRPDELCDLAATIDDMRAALSDSYLALRDSEARYRELFTNTPVALWEQDFSEVRPAIEALAVAHPDLSAHLDAHPEEVRGLAARVRVLDVNDATLAMHGATRVEEMARLTLTFTPASYEAFKRELLAIWRGEWDLTLDTEIRTLDGDIREVVLRWYVPPAHRDTAAKVIVSIEDVTERKAAERSLEITLEKLTQANSELERFAFVASHDLQEPVRNVVSFSQLLERRLSAEASPDEDSLEFLHFLRAAALRMQEQITGLLAYSHAGQVTRAFEPLPLTAAANDAADLLRDAIAVAGARMTIEPLPVVVGDRAQLAAAFRQLFDNALKFRREDVAPQIRVTARRLDNEWLISVSDNGIGVDPLYAADIFQVFRRLHGPGHYAGAGIGLATCRRIIERHGGRIWLSPATSPGATFHFTLPAREV